MLKIFFFSLSIHKYKVAVGPKNMRQKESVFRHYMQSSSVSDVGLLSSVSLLRAKNKQQLYLHTPFAPVAICSVSAVFFEVSLNVFSFWVYMPFSLKNKKLQKSLSVTFCALYKCTTKLLLIHNWTIKKCSFELMHSNFLLRKGGKRKMAEVKLLVLLMMSCPFKSRHLHLQMDQQWSPRPPGTEVILTFLFPAQEVTYCEMRQDGLC